MEFSLHDMIELLERDVTIWHNQVEKIDTQVATLKKERKALVGHIQLAQQTRTQLRYLQEHPIDKGE